MAKTHYHWATLWEVKPTSDPPVSGNEVGKRMGRCLHMPPCITFLQRERESERQKKKEKAKKIVFASIHQSLGDVSLMEKLWPYVESRDGRYYFGMATSVDFSLKLSFSNFGKYLAVKNA